jgi:hypothetical protein
MGLSVFEVLKLNNNIVTLHFTDFKKISLVYEWPQKERILALSQ